MKHPEAGGAELVIFKVMEQLKKKGHEVTFFVGKFKGAKKIDNYKGIKIIRSGNRFLTYLNAAFFYLINSKNYDVIFDCVNGVPYWTPLYVRKKRIVYFHHVVGKIAFKKLHFPMSLIAYVAEQIFLPLFYKNEQFIAVSKVTKKELVELGINKENIKVIYNGLDHETYKPGEKSKKPRIIFVGRLERYKRTLMLIDIFKKIKKNIDLEMLVIGSGRDFSELKKRSKNLKDFHVLGFIDEKEKLKLMKSAWLAVTPSMKEGWGLTVLESNACKVPVVCFDVPGLNEAVLNGKTGFLVKTEKEFVEKCIEVLRDNKLRDKLSKNAVEWAKKFTWEKTADENLKLINQKV